MDLITATSKSLTFYLSEREQRLLFEVLKFYPLLPLTYHQISRSHHDPKLIEAQQLLEESLAQEKKVNRQELEKLLSSPDRLISSGNGYRLELSFGEINWLLQILNDIRVGSWHRLGSPAEIHVKMKELNDENAPYFLAMEMSAYFQQALLEALSQSDDSDSHGTESA